LLPNPGKASVPDTILNMNWVKTLGEGILTIHLSQTNKPQIFTT